MQVLVDGDVLAYRCAFAAERVEYCVQYTDDKTGDPVKVWCENKKGATAVAASLSGKGITAIIEPRVNLEPVQNALYNVRSMMQSISDELNASMEELTVVLSGPTNFRTDIAQLKEYKGHRVDKRTPAHGDAVRDYLFTNYNSVITKDEEADDYMGYTQYRDWASLDTVIATIDKDLDMIPGLHYNFVKEEAYTVNDQQANAFFWTQLLSGDPTDNIPGVPKIGPVLAERHMQDAWTNGVFDEKKALEIALALYVQGYGEEDAKQALTENGQLLWIRREPGQIWTPQFTE